MTDVIQILNTLSEIMTFMAPNLGGAVPDEDSSEYLQWRLGIQLKQEEAARRGFWRRLLTKEIMPLRAGDNEIVLPIRFQRANALYIFAVDGVDLADPDRIPDGQSLFAQVINDPDDEDYGLWQLNFETTIESNADATMWYFASPPKPVEPADQVLLPGDMVGFGAMSEIFRTTNLSGSQDDARQEYENRLSTYLAMESIPARNELLSFTTNPRGIDRTVKARKQYAVRPDRTGREL